MSAFMGLRNFPSFIAISNFSFFNTFLALFNFVREVALVFLCPLFQYASEDLNLKPFFLWKLFRWIKENCHSIILQIILFVD